MQADSDTQRPTDASPAADAPIGPGALVLVVGPSGAGKDTLIRLVKDACAADPAVLFPRRLITRGPDVHEDHTPIDEATFMSLQQSGGAALSWRAHGLGYAVPAAIDDVIRAGGVVVVNVSRRIIADAVKRYARVAVVLITAPADVLAERLARRGREAAADVAGRLDRAADAMPAGADVTVIQNVGDPTVAAARFIDLVRGLAAGNAVSGAQHTEITALS